MRRFWALVVGLAVSVSAQWSAPQVGSFAVATVTDPGIVKNLRDRFKATGTPVFLMGNSGLGLQQGDLIRFADKAVFVDADVWQTLAAEGALRALKQAPVVRVKAGATATAWMNRAKLVPSPRERRLYEFGASLLKVLEASVGNPDGQKVFLSFEGGQMVLTAPAAFLDRMRSGGGGASAGASEAKDRTVVHGHPKWVSRPPAEVFGRFSRLDWTAWAVDDSGGPTAGYRYRVEGAIPPGLTWNSERHRMEGILGQTGVWKMQLHVQDAYGASDSLFWRLEVTSAPAQNLTSATDASAIGIELPLDTLTESRWHRWDLGDQAVRWDRAGVRLDSVECDLADVRFQGTVLQVRPRQAGNANLRFLFRRKGALSIVARSCPVRPFPLPIFLSSNGGSSLVEGQTRVYRPIARDGYGGLVTIEAEVPDDPALDWDGVRLRVSPTAPGAWSIRFTARDSMDHATEQWVTFVSEAKSISRWNLETRWVEGANPWLVTGEFGRGRFSLFTPKASRLVEWGDAVKQDWPFILLGANLLGAESIRRGHAFSVDLGGTLRLPDAAVLTGGVMGRIQARYDNRPSLPWVFEGEFMGWVHQAILATDTSRLRTTMAASNDGATLDDFIGRYGRVLGQVLADGFNSHNAVFLTRVEGWLQLPASIYLGVGWWRADLPVAVSMNQRISTGLRWAPTGRLGAFSASVRAGWGPGDAGFASWWDLRWSSGILP